MNVFLLPCLSSEGKVESYLDSLLILNMLLPILVSRQLMQSKSQKESKLFRILFLNLGYYVKYLIWKHMTMLKIQLLLVVHF